MENYENNKNYENNENEGIITKKLILSYSGEIELFNVKEVFLINFFFI